MWRYGVLFRAPLGQKLRMELIYEIFYFILFYFIS